MCCTMEYYHLASVPHSHTGPHGSNGKDGIPALRATFDWEWSLAPDVVSPCCMDIAIAECFSKPAVSHPQSTKIPNSRGPPKYHLSSMALKGLMADPLEASSYFHPSGGAVYAPLREKVVAQATAMGYDVPTMTEHGVVWADDQDPFGHVGGATYIHLLFKCNFRLFESFAKTLKHKYEGLFRATEVGVMTKTYATDLKRQVTYPDCVSWF